VVQESLSLRILVDGRVMRDRYHGIGRVTFELLRELCTRDVKLIVLHGRDSGRLPLSELLAQPSVQPVPSSAPAGHPLLGGGAGTDAGDTAGYPAVLRGHARG
jgi:hypothetical protein